MDTEFLAPPAFRRVIARVPAILLCLEMHRVVLRSPPLSANCGTSISMRYRVISRTTSPPAAPSLPPRVVKLTRTSAVFAHPPRTCGFPPRFYRDRPRTEVVSVFEAAARYAEVVAAVALVACPYPGQGAWWRFDSRRKVDSSILNGLLRAV
jgi:hypothetical protein